MFLRLLQILLHPLLGRLILDIADVLPVIEILSFFFLALPLLHVYGIFAGLFVLFPSRPFLCIRMERQAGQQDEKKNTPLHFD